MMNKNKFEKYSSTIENAIEFKIYIYIHIINCYKNELSLLKKYVLLLYLLYTGNNQQMFISIKKNTKSTTQINNFIKKITEYDCFDNFSKFIEINNLINLNEKFILEKCALGNINFQQDDIWFKVEIEMNDVQLGGAFYDRF